MPYYGYLEGVDLGDDISPNQCKVCGCAGDKIKIEKIDKGYFGGFQYYCICPRCAEQSRSGKTKYRAILEWNKHKPE